MAQLSPLPPSPLLAAPPRSWISASLWAFMLLSSTAIAAYGLSYFFHTPRDSHFFSHISMLRLHIAGGAGALLAGPWQFSQRLRARALNLHRWIGRFYLIEVALGSIGVTRLPHLSPQV